MPKRFEGMSYWEIISRQMSIVTKYEQNKFKDSEITVIGCGGIGGSVIEMLSRMGIGKLVVIDKDEFDISNINRQTMSSFHSVGKSKTEITKNKVNEINPFVKIEAINTEINEDNVKDIIFGSDIVIDALDNLFTRVVVSRMCMELEIPFVHGAVHGTMGQVTVFDKNTVGYEELFNLPSKNQDLSQNFVDELNSLSKDTPPSIAPVPNIVGCLEAMESFKYITGIGDVILAPKLLSFDLLKNIPFNSIEL